MPPFRKPSAPLRKLSSQNTAAGVYTPPAPTPVQTTSRPVVHQAPQAESNEIANQSRLAAGATGNGFTCIRCLQWFPAGTHHACRPYAEVIRNLETPEIQRGPMTSAEIELLQQDGQL